MLFNSFEFIIFFVIVFALYYKSYRHLKFQDRKRFLMLSLLINLGFLGFFKYYNFFAESFVDFVSIFGFETSPYFLNIVLPVGISFYTFQTMSYTIDIYRYKMKSTNNLLEFMTFVSFFPQLVAGPIERAANLLPQFEKKRVFNKIEFREGIKQSLWGYLKK